MKRYQVVTHSFDIGSDEHGDYSRFAEAVKAAGKFLGHEEYVAIYDRKTKAAYVIFGDPDRVVFSDFVTVNG